MKNATIMINEFTKPTVTRRSMEDITNTFHLRASQETLTSKPSKSVQCDLSSPSIIAQLLSLTEEKESLQVKVQSLSKRLRHKETEYQHLVQELEGSNPLILKLKERSKDLELAHSKIKDLEGKDLNEIVHSSRLSKECESLKHKLEVCEEDKGNLKDKLNELIEANLGVKRECESLKLQLEICKEEKEKMVESSKEPLNERVMKAISQFSNMIYSKVGISSLDPKIKQLLKELLSEDHLNQVKAFEDKLSTLRKHNHMLSSELFNTSETLQTSIQKVSALKGVRESAEFCAIRSSQQDMIHAWKESKAVISLAARLSEDFETDNVHDTLQLRKRVIVLEDELERVRNNSHTNLVITQASAIEELLSR